MWDQQAMGSKPILCPGPLRIKTGRPYSGPINTLERLIYKIPDVLPPQIVVNLQPGLFCSISILQKHPVLVFVFVVVVNYRTCYAYKYV